MQITVLSKDISLLGIGVHSEEVFLFLFVLSCIHVVFVQNDELFDLIIHHNIDHRQMVRRNQVLVSYFIITFGKLCVHGSETLMHHFDRVLYVLAILVYFLHVFIFLMSLFVVHGLDDEHAEVAYDGSAFAKEPLQVRVYLDLELLVIEILSWRTFLFFLQLSCLGIPFDHIASILEATVLDNNLGTS